MTSEILAGTFLDDLVDQVRAADTYGRLDGVGDLDLLRQYLVEPALPGEVELMCVADPAAVARLRAFFRAVATGIERATGLVTNQALDLDQEGFGRAVVFVGRLVVLCELLRDVNGFGFRTLDALAAHGRGLVEAATETASAHPEVTHAQP